MDSAAGAGDVEGRRRCDLLRLRWSHGPLSPAPAATHPATPGQGTSGAGAMAPVGCEPIQQLRYEHARLVGLGPSLGVLGVEHRPRLLVDPLHRHPWWPTPVPPAQAVPGRALKPEIEHRHAHRIAVESQGLRESARHPVAGARSSYG